MKQLKKNVLPLLLALVMLLSACGIWSEAEFKGNHTALPHLIDRYEAGEGTFTLDKKCCLVATDGVDAQTAEFIQMQFSAAGYPSMSLQNEAKAGGKNLFLRLDTAIPVEGYEITVEKNSLTLKASDARGLMYGTFMLIKTLRANGGNSIGGCTMADVPDAAERVVMIDCGRKYYTVEWLCNFIRQSAYMGYNAIELRFSDDQGTRFDIWEPEYFTDNVNGNDFSWICGGYVGSWVKETYHDYEDERKYLRANEIDQIMKVAAEYQMEVIPGFDSPGHCQYLCRAFENGGTVSLKFNYDGKTYSFLGVKENGETIATASQLAKQYPNADFSSIFTGNHITLDVTNPYGRAYILAIIEDYARFFRQYGCDTFHIGGDEVRLHTNSYGSVDWENYVAEGYSKYDTCVDYINEQTAMLKELGYQVRAFSDFIDYVSEDPDYTQHIEIDPDIELSYWIGDYDLETVRPVTHFLGKRKIFNCLQNYCYYSLTESVLGADGRDPDTRDWDFYYSTEDRIYENWNPTVFEWPEDPGEGCVVDPSEVEGGYFLIWCDNAAQSTQTEIWNGIDKTGKYNLIDRMWSNTYKMWNYDLNETLSFEDFCTWRDSLGYFPGYTDCDSAPQMG